MKDAAECIVVEREEIRMSSVPRYDGRSLCDGPTNKIPATFQEKVIRMVQYKKQLR